MSIFKSKRPTIDEVQNRITELENRAQAVDDELRELEDRLAEQTALGQNTNTTLNQISKLEAEQRSIPRSLELLQQELRDMQTEQVERDFEARRKKRDKALEILKPKVDAVEEAVNAYLAAVEELDLEGVQCRSADPATILKQIRVRFPLDNFTNESETGLQQKEAEHLKRIGQTKAAPAGDNSRTLKPSYDNPPKGDGYGSDKVAG